MHIETPHIYLTELASFTSHNFSPYLLMSLTLFEFADPSPSCSSLI